MDSWDALLLADMEPLGACNLGDTATEPNLKVCSYNVNALNQYKLAIFVCIDTRHRESSNRAYTKQA